MDFRLAICLHPRPRSAIASLSTEREHVSQLVPCVWSSVTRLWRGTGSVIFSRSLSSSVVPLFSFKSFLPASETGRRENFRLKKGRGCLASSPGLLFQTVWSRASCPPCLTVCFPAVRQFVSKFVWTGVVGIFVGGGLLLPGPCKKFNSKFPNKNAEGKTSDLLKERFPQRFCKIAPDTHFPRIPRTRCA